MPTRYRYERLRVARYEPVDFALFDIRAAVEVLRATPNPDPETSCIGLEAVTIVRAAGFILRARPRIRLEQLVGRTPAEVWAMFDAEVDEQRKGLVRRRLGYEPSNYDTWLA